MSTQDDVHREAVHDWLDRREPPDRPTAAELADDRPRRPVYRLYVNHASTVFVRIWRSGLVEVASRRDRDATWGPPMPMTEEHVPA